MDVGSLANQVLLIINNIIGNKLGTFSTYEDIQKKYMVWREPTNTDMINAELGYILLEYLIPKGYILSGKKNPTQPSSTKYKITPDGYTYLHEMQTIRHDSNIGFCAIWFDQCMDIVWKNAIKPAIEDSGFQAFRIDEQHHNNDINAEIISNLNKSKFVVADFIGNRGGVYFEAGYAKGKNIEVIYTCNKDKFKENKPHFDVEHYNFITWENNSLEIFRNTLRDRIIQTITSNYTDKE